MSTITELTEATFDTGLAAIPLPTPIIFTGGREARRITGAPAKARLLGELAAIPAGRSDLV